MTSINGADRLHNFCHVSNASDDTNLGSLIMILNNAYMKTKTIAVPDFFKITVQNPLWAYKTQLWINTKNFLVAIVNNEIIFLVMYIIVGSRNFISIISKYIKIGFQKFQCTSKLFCQFLSSLYFIGLINLYI